MIIDIGHTTFYYALGHGGTPSRPDEALARCVDTTHLAGSGREEVLKWSEDAVLTLYRRLPVCPDKQTLLKSVGMSQTCH
jgi:hypothetical protein